jgi:hypothetical protein
MQNQRVEPDLGATRQTILPEPEIVEDDADKYFAFVQIAG